MSSATPARTLVIAAGKLAVTFLAILIVVSQIDFSFFASHWNKLSIFTVVALLVVLASQTSFIAGLRLKLVLDGLKQRRRVRETIQVALSGFFFEQVAFGFVGGDAMRLWLLHQMDVPLRSAIQAIAVDRCLGLFGLFLLALAGLPSLGVLLTGHDWQVVVIAGISPISAGGWGLREAGFVVALATFGIRPEEAILPPVIFGLGVLIVTLPGGVIWLANRKRKAATGATPTAHHEIRGGEGRDHAAGPACGRAAADRTDGYSHELVRLS